MSKDELAFIAKFAESPDDDLPRLAFCDWLEERDGDEACYHCNGTGEQRYADAAGDMDERPCPWCNATGELPNGYATWAAFIRAQIEEASREWLVDPHEGHTCAFDPCPLCSDVVDRKKLWKIERHWLETNRKTLQKRWHPLTIGLLRQNFIEPYDGTQWAMFHRGFIQYVRCTMHSWVKHGPSICAEHPITRVNFTDRHPYLSMAGNYYWGDGWEHDPELNFNAIWEIPRGFFPPGAGPNMAYSSAELAFDDLSARSIAWARLIGDNPDPKAGVTPKRIMH